MYCKSMGNCLELDMEYNLSVTFNKVKVMKFSQPMLIIIEAYRR